METSKFANFFNPGKNLHPVILTDSIKLYFHYLSGNKRKFTISNKAQMAGLYADLCVYIQNHNARRYSSLSEVRYMLERHLGISGSNTLAEALVGNEKKLKAAGYPTALFIGCKGRKGHSKKGQKQNGVKAYTDAKCCKDITRSIAIRGAFGNFPVMFFEISGRMDGCSKEIIAAKMEYHYQTGCPYFQARPCLLASWLTMPEWRQSGTLRVEKVGKGWD